jgi:hypothetical protein
MEFRFNAGEWANMTPAQRIKRCTTLAEEAQKLADQADEKFKPFYLDLTAQWFSLAREIRRAEMRFSLPTPGAGQGRIFDI